MQEPPDWSELADRFLSLWQAQMTAMATDPDLAETAGRVIAGTMNAVQSGAMGGARWPKNTASEKSRWPTA